MNSHEDYEDVEELDPISAAVIIIAVMLTGAGLLSLVMYSAYLLFK